LKRFILVRRKLLSVIFCSLLLVACQTTTLTPPPSPTQTIEVTTIPTPPITLDGAPIVFVPAGEFTMGGDLLPNQRPIHTVSLDAFWIDRYEVTNMLFQKCVAAQHCQTPSEIYSDRHPNGYYNNPEFADFPMASVAWADADQYCRWAGKRLPTEAEWEKAARGSDARLFPWGNTFDPDRANSAFNLDLVTTAVDSHPTGASPYGAQDMAGNVWEWVADWYDETYYTRSPNLNPSGPLTGTLRVARGGGYGSYDTILRSTTRRELSPDDRASFIGFRCARSIGLGAR
jgi:formylglycine-generating enzyme required for sulfatase activity